MSCWNNSLSTFRDAPVPTHEHVRHGRVSMVVWLACLASTESLSHFACGLDTGALNWRRPRWLGTVPCKYCMHAQQLLTQEQFTVASSRSVVREPISQHPCPAREQDRRWPLTMQFFRDQDNNDVSSEMLGYLRHSARIRPRHFFIGRS